MTDVISVDTEVTTYNFGNCYDQRNDFVCFSWATEDSSGACKASEGSIQELRERINGCRILTGFNIKFDIHWLWRLGISIPENVRVFDCQSGEFILTNQTTRFP